MEQTRLYVVSQGYLAYVEDINRGWALMGLLCLFIVFLIGYLVVSHKQRVKAERFRLLREQEKRSMAKGEKPLYRKK